MGRLKKALEQHAAALGIPRTVYMPKVTQPVLIAHRAQRTAMLMGRLAEKPPREGQPVQGLLVKRGGAHIVLHHDDLPKFTKLHPGRVLQRQAVALHRPVAEVRWLKREGGWGGGREGGWGTALCVAAARGTAAAPPPAPRRSCSRGNHPAPRCAWRWR